MAEFSSEQYQKALEAMQKMTTESGKLREGINAAASEFLGISGAAFTKEVAKTSQEIRAQRAELGLMKDGLDEMATKIKENLNPAFKSVFEEAELKFQNLKEIDFSELSGSIKEVFKEENFSSFSDLKDKMLEMEALSEKDKAAFEEKFNKTGEFGRLQEKVKEKELKHLNQLKDINEKLFDSEEGYLRNLEEEEQIAIKRLLSDGKKNEALAMAVQLSGELIANDEKGLDSLLAQNDELISAEKHYGNMVGESKKLTNNVFDLSKGIESFSNNVRKGAIDSILAFDKAIHEAQKNTGIMFTENEYAMSSLATQTASYGMSIGDTTEMMGNLGDELRTTDFGVLAKATKDFAAIGQATGVASKDIAAIAGEMMRFGASSEQVKEAFEFANVQAKLMGVNTKKLLESVSRNINKMRQFGFQGGEESLIKMTATAEKLRMNVDEIFDVAKRARTIEGAMDMAAQLQLAGGSFAQIDPMSLLSAARKGPEELQKILTQMGGDIGSFVEDAEGNKKFKFDAIDVDRLQMVADATGQSMDSLQNMIQGNAEALEKEKLIPDNFFDLGKDSEEIKSLIMGATKMKGGKLIADDNLKALGDSLNIDTSDLTKLSADDKKALLEKQKANAVDLEAQARANEDMRKSFDNFINSFMTALTIFQPLLDILGSAFQMFNDAATMLPVWSKALVGALLAFGLGAGKLVLGLAKWGGSFLKNIKSFGGLFSKGKEDVVSNLKDKASGGKDQIAGGMDKAKGKPGDFLKSLAKGLGALGNAKVYKGIGALALMGPAMLVFAPALIPLALMIPLGAGGKLIEQGFKAIGKGVSFLGKRLAEIAKGALAMALIGASFIPFAFSMQMMAGLSWDGILKGFVAMGIAIGALFLVGAIAAGPGGVLLLAGALALVAVGAALVLASASLIVAAEGFNRLAEVNWGALAPMGDVLPRVGLGLAAFALSALMFANPASLIGLGIMAVALAGLVAIMSPLASALSIGAEGMNDFAAGVENLKTALNDLSMEKLEQLEDTSSALAAANVGSAINSLASSVGNLIGGDKKEKEKSGKQEITINLKMNGREMKNFIVEDTKHLT